MPKAPDCQQGLSKENCDCLKGLFSICVLVHHLYQNSGLFHNTILGMGLQFLGYLSVGVFFFISGYGLMRSHQMKGFAYIKTFPKRRILPFYVIILLLIGMYALEKRYLGYKIGYDDIVRSLLFGGTIIDNGWYLQTQMLCYLLFYLIFYTIRNTSLCLTVMSVLHAVYIVVMAVLGYSSTWYVSTPLFVIGMIYAHCDGYSDKAFSKNHGVKQLVIESAILLGLMLSYKTAQMMQNQFWQAVLISFSECCFVLVVLTLIRIIRINNKLTRWLGSISLEIYVTQGIFLTAFHSDRLKIQNAYLYVLAVSFCTIASAVILHPIIALIFSAFGGNRVEPRKK